MDNSSGSYLDDVCLFGVQLLGKRGSSHWCESATIAFEAWPLFFMHRLVPSHHFPKVRAAKEKVPNVSTPEKGPYGCYLPGSDGHSYMSYNLNSLKGAYIRGLYRGVL